MGASPSWVRIPPSPPSSFTRTGPDRGKWSFRYQRLGKKREMGLGPYPAISLAEARQLHSLIHQGKDPLFERREAERQRRKREGKKFSDIARQYIEEHKSEWTNAKHAQDWASTLKRLAYPALDQKPFADLTTEDVIEVLSPVWQSKRETAKKLSQGGKIMIFSKKNSEAHASNL